MRDDTRVRIKTLSLSPIWAVLSLLTMVLAGAMPAAAQIPDMPGMDIGATTCVADGDCYQEIGAVFNVTSLEGELIGSCTLEGNRYDTSHIQSCKVPVPRSTTVVVTIDTSTITLGTAPLENPIYFDTSGDPGAASHWGISFRNEPVGTTASGASNVSIVTMQAQHGAYYDACYVLVDFSNEGCDENRDGMVTFMDVPAGTYTVRQTRDLGMTAHVPDFQITVTGQSADGWESFETWVTHRSTDAQSNHVAIQTTENGQPVTDVCYELVGFSNIGCDENGDGQVTFMDIPFGSYVVRQTADLGPNRVVPDFTIEVSDSGLRNGWLTFPTSVITSAEHEPIDISLITRDPDDGHLLTDTCYVLVDFSNEGCDENGDGQVTFAQIPPGTYTVRQTKTPAGYPAINEFEIRVLPLGDLPNGEILQVPLGFVVKQAPEQNAPDTLNVSVILIDYATGEKLDTGICAELVGASNIGCDEDLVDGQIDFLDVPAGGPYELRFSNIPDGMREGVGIDGPYEVWIQPETYPSPIVFAFILFDQVESNSIVSGTANATLLMTMRGCPEGFNPNVDDFFANCTIPLDAPDASFLYHGGDGQGGMNIMWMDRKHNGAYIFNAGPYTMNVTLSGLAPVVRDGYTVVGADSVDGDQATINLVDGETREVWVFYYYLP